MVGLPSAPSLLHAVVDFEDDALGRVLAVFGLVLGADDEEGVEDVGDGVAGRGGRCPSARRPHGAPQFLHLRLRNQAPRCQT